MSEVHRIRLRGPWEVTALTDTRATVRMTIPCSWKDGGWPGFSGRARHDRSFGQPRQADPRERVWLVIEGISGTGTVRLNEHELGAIAGSSTIQFDITDLLDARNRLQIEIVAADDSGGVTGEVALEIRGA